MAAAAASDRSGAQRLLAAVLAATGASFLLCWVLARRKREALADQSPGAAVKTAEPEPNLQKATPAKEEASAELEELAAAGGFGNPRPSRDPQVRPRPVLGSWNGDAIAANGGNVPGTQSVFVKTFGCAHNSSDSEFMMGLLQEYGYALVDKFEEADVCLVNSCTVKNPSQDTAVNLVKKAQTVGKPVILAGCVPAADSSVAEGLPGVSVVDVTQIDRVVAVVEEALQGHTVRLTNKRRALPTLDLPKVRKNKYVEIIPLSGGCLGNCSYCKTKHARGTLSSYTEEAIISRAVQAAGDGASEVWLASEDTGAYGIDLGTDIASLLNKVADALPPGVMLKLGMTNPPYMMAHMEAVAKVLQRPNVFEFIHIPVQSGSTRVLQSMVREYSIEEFSHLVDGLREAVPNILVATDIICGFPAESEEDHQESLDLVKKYRFPVLNISQFYARPGTPAARMKRLPGHLAKARSTEMTMLFDSYETYGHLVGREERVWFCDTEEKHGQTVGHTKGYVKVVVPRNDHVLGRSALVRVLRTTKWHAEGEIVRDVR